MASWRANLVEEMKRNLLVEEGLLEDAPEPVAPRLPGYDVRGVLAGCYKGKDISERALRTHYYIPGRKRTLCGSVKADHLVDEFGDDGVQSPTCPRCQEKAQKKGRKA